MEFRILGPLEVIGPDGPIAIDAGKVRALFELLLLHANEVIQADRLVDSLWGESPSESAEHAVEVYVSRLRRALGPDRIETHGRGYRVRVEAGELDLHRFETLTADARGALAADDPGRAVRLFHEAEALWRGPALTDLRSTEGSAAEVTRLDELRLATTEARIDAMLVTGRHAELVPELKQLIADEPFRERLLAQYMLALYRSGRQVDALAAYQHARRALDQEMGLEPGPALQQLQVAILRQDLALDVADTTLGTATDMPRGFAEPQATGIREPRARPRRVALVALLTVLLVGTVAVLYRSVTTGAGPRPSGLAGAGSSPSTIPSPVAAPTLAPDEEALFRQLPGAVGDDCSSTSAPGEAVGNVASLHCVLPPVAEVEQAWFDRFETLDSLNAVVDDLVQKSGAPAGTCETMPRAAGTWEIPDVHRGRLLCYAADGEVWIVWTYEDDRILARATRHGNDWHALYEWWRNTAMFLR